MGRLAADCHQVGFSQYLQHLILLQELDGGSKVNVGTKEKNVQQVRQIELRDASGALLLGIERLGPKLLGGYRANRVGCTGAEEIDAKSRQLGTVRLGEAHFQHHLSLSWRQR